MHEVTLAQQPQELLHVARHLVAGCLGVPLDHGGHDRRRVTRAVDQLPESEPTALTLW